VDTGNPLRGALVQVTAAELQVRRAANTDADGRYEVDALPAGRYTLSVSKGGYVTLQFGQQRPFEQGRPLELSDAQIVDRIDFGLPRGGVITGRIVDAFGDPIAGIRVDARRYQYLPGGQRQLVPAGFFGVVPSDDRGHYRIYGLMPGTYVVAASPGGSAMVVMPGPGGALTSVSANAGLATTYFPGTAAADDAQAVTVMLGQEAIADFALVGVKAARVAGLVRDSQGKPFSRASITLRQSRMMSGEQPNFSQTGEDGAFTIANVAPGEYVLDVRHMRRGPTTTTPDEFAAVPVSVAGEDITNLLITTSTGASVRGRVIFEGAKPPTSGGLPLRILPASSEPGMNFMPMTSSQDNGLVEADSTFQITGVSGNVLFRATPMPPGWTQKRVTLGGRDITDTGIEVPLGDSVTGLEVVVTDRESTLAGTVRNTRGALVTDYVLVVLPRYAKEGTNQMRFVATARPDQQGRFQMRGRPPGEYVALALPSLDQSGAWDPSVQERVRAEGKPFVLREGESLTLELQISSTNP
jgi:protocatechuate 3,4-dioxygenase beta subunit